MILKIAKVINLIEYLIKMQIKKKFLTIVNYN